ncbi:Bax inhibitor-1/YccA family protein [Emticicia sp. SJ17W-69]|uniref:Bax inhibitor-1/YccA family protein n=1 Tax=Emticicia sp. SJ17W-69 TaxID=3421657 RepID=UPI003EBF98FD
MNNFLTQDEIRAAQASFMQKVFGWMAAALAVTALTAMYVASSLNLVEIIIGNKIVFYALIFGELGLVIWLTSAMRTMSSTTAMMLFFAYALMNGLTLSVIFLAYTADSLAGTFFISGGMFMAMSAFGYFTKRDLTSWGSLLFMALIGIIIATVVNMFWKNDMFQLIISYIGVVIFVGLTAYDTQKIKELHLENADSETQSKGAIMGALTLYLDFINLFLYLLRIFGRKK